MKRITSLLLAMALALGLTACSDEGNLEDLMEAGTAQVLDEVMETTQTPDSSDGYAATEDSADTSVLASTSSNLEDSSYEQTELPEEGKYYYDLENVVLYLDAYGELPDNYITKDEAWNLGWEGGTPEHVQEGSAIGGDRFGNREGLLPTANGRSYTECDLNTNGADSRGAERLVFSNDGLYFHTDDHYETFTEVWVENGEVVW